MAELRLSDISAVRAAMQEAKGTVQTLWTDDSGEHDEYVFVRFADL